MGRTRGTCVAAAAAALLLLSVACSPTETRGAPPVLLFAGAGTSANDVAAIEGLLSEQHLHHDTVDSRQLNDLSASRLRAYRLLIIPGGDFIVMGGSLAPATTARIHDAVKGGVNYLGICAGAFLAGHGSYNSANLAVGARFGCYGLEDRGVRKAAVAITRAGAPALDQYWEDGPRLTGWGAVVGKYPDGTPAIVEGASGKGWVILCGVHPEAPASWRSGMAFTTPASEDNAYAATLVVAALDGRSLPHFRG